MKYFKFSLLIVLLLNSVFAQNGFLVKEGQKFKVHTESFFTTMDEDQLKKYNKSKGEDRAKIVNEVNQDFITGKRKNTSGWKVSTDMKVEKIESNDKGQRVVTTMETPGKKWYFVSAFKNDTFYFSRNSGPVFSVYQGDTIGMGIQGIKQIPANLQVGSSLKKYYDYGMIFDKATDVTLKKSVFSHMTTKTSLERNTFGLDTRTGQFGFGDFQVTSTHAVYNSIDVAARKHFECNSYTINYAVSNVGDKQSIIVHGKTYDAYLITSEQWMKNDAKFVFESEDKATEKKANTEAEKMALKTREAQIKKGLLNSEGYVVTKYKEWYVPGIGVVRTEIYDASGFITSIMTIEYL